MSDAPPPPWPGSTPPPPPSAPSAPGWGQAPPPPGYGQPGYPQAPYGQQPSYGYGYGQPTADYAGFGARLGGYLLDSLLYGLVSAPFLAVGVAILLNGPSRIDSCPGDEPGLCEIPEASSWLGFGALALAGVIVAAVLYFRHLGRTGQTWGRKIVGIKVIGQQSGQPIGVGRAIGRQLFAGFISGQICYLGYLWMLWDRDKQTWHDKVVGSIVVRA